MSNQKKIAIVGSGISGLSAAYFLKDIYEVHLFEKLDRIGGHSNTILVNIGEEVVPVDTGFIVFNKFTYPNLIKFFENLKIPILQSDMSFSVSFDDGQIEYAGGNINSLFSQSSNLVNIAFWRMLKDIFRFNHIALKTSRLIDYELTLEEFLNKHSFSKSFRDWYLYPMAAAIWSMPLQNAGEYPARTLIDFFHNHRLLKTINQHPWLTIKGGSQNYVQKIASQLENVHTNTEVTSVISNEKIVKVSTTRGKFEFDAIILATDCASPLSLLAEASPLQREILGGFKVSQNKAVLHWDDTFMPRRKKAWASWNVIIQDEISKDVSISYWMNRLQGLDLQDPLFVTLNPFRNPDPKKVIFETDYVHPYFDADTIKMQKRLSQIQGLGRIWYAGAYNGFGFHEDGLRSGMFVAQKLGGKIPWKQ